MDTTSLVFYVVIIVAFAALTIIPQRKRQKKQKEMMDSLSIGDSISTIGGICGVIKALRGDTVIIETGNNGMEMELLRQAISTIRGKNDHAELAGETE